MKPKETYNCGVVNCGNGKCIHKLLEETCFNCGSRMVEVITTGFKFCSNNENNCDFEYEDDKY